MQKQTDANVKAKPPAQQPPSSNSTKKVEMVDAKQSGERPWKFCWYDVFRGPYVEHTSKPEQPKVDMEPYDFEKLLKVKLENRP